MGKTAEGAPGAICVVKERDWAMFLTYESVHCVHATAALRRTWCNCVQYCMCRLTLLALRGVKQL